jgi:hypothetical protein
MWVLSFFCGACILTLGYVLSAYERSPSDGWYLGWLTVSLAFLAFALWARSRSKDEQRARRALPFLLAGTLGMFAVWGPPSTLALELLIVGAALLHLAVHKRLTLERCLRQIFPLLLAGFLIVGVRKIWINPNIEIDVFLVQQAAVKALLELRNPYTATIPDIYGPSSPYYIPLVKDGQTIYGFVYPPLIAILHLPSYLLTADVRYTYVVALAISSALIAWMRPSWVSLCAAVLLLINPLTQKLIATAWIEPLVILFLALTLFGTLRYPKAVPYLFGLFLATKQTSLAAVVLAPLLAAGFWDCRKMVGFLAKSLGVVCLLYLPFFLWNREAFVTSLVTVQLRVPTRLDLISYPAFFAKKGWLTLPPWLPFLYLPIGTWMGLRRVPRTAAGFAVAAALLFIPFFALSKQGSPNYYFFGLGILCCALGLLTPSVRDRDETAMRPAEVIDPETER